MRQMIDEGVYRLIEAVIERAVVDYRAALYQYNTAKGRGKKLEHRHMALECERFFRQEMEFYCDLDGEMIIQRVRNEVRKLLSRNGIMMEVPR